MKNDSFPYFVTHQRDLTQVEADLLGFMSGQIPTKLSVSEQPKIVARRGCGACPTVLFGRTLDDEPVTSSNSNIVGTWSGRASNGTLVGISLWAKDGFPTELEAWSVDGGEVETWPPLDSIEPSSG